MDKEASTRLTRLVVHDRESNEPAKRPIPEFASAADARAAGLEVGRFFRTGEVVKVVTEP